MSLGILVRHIRCHGSTDSAWCPARLAGYSRPGRRLRRACAELPLASTVERLCNLWLVALRAGFRRLASGYRSVDQLWLDAPLSWADLVPVVSGDASQLGRDSECRSACGPTTLARRKSLALTAYLAPT
jgi:hypothetical protein